MPHENKYGHVTIERGSIPEDEPVVLFRGRDALLPQLLCWYRARCIERGSPHKHIDLIKDTLRQIEHWQDENYERVQVPRSDSYEPGKL